MQPRHCSCSYKVALNYSVLVMISCCRIIKYKLYFIEYISNLKFKQVYFDIHVITAEASNILQIHC